MNKQATRTPLGFVDNEGYVTPFNGRIVDNMPGRYIYTQAEMDFYLAQQQLMERDRDNQRFSRSEDTEASAPVPPAGVDLVPQAPVPPMPPAGVAKPMDPTVPPTFTNLTQEQMDNLPSGFNGNDVARHVMNTK